MDELRKLNPKYSILDRPIPKGKSEINLSTFALLFSEIVSYSQSRVMDTEELHKRLSDIGKHVGSRYLDLLWYREKGFKRENRILQVLLFVKSQLYKSLFGKEADKLEVACDSELTYYLSEKEALVNRYISPPQENKGINCAAFNAGIVEGFICGLGFDCTVTCHWHKGTTLMIKFHDSVLQKIKQVGR